MSKCRSNPKQCERKLCDHDGSWNPTTSKRDPFNCTMPMFGGRSYMNIDVGLYVKFGVDEGNSKGYGHGRPTDCSGLNRPDWIQNKEKREGKNGRNKPFDPKDYLEYSSLKYPSNYVANARFSDLVVEDGDVVRFSGCPLNNDIVEGGEKMYEIFEEFSNDNQLWVNEFVDVFQKMLENGYQSGNEKGNSQLVESEVPWKEITCTDSKRRCNSLLLETVEPCWKRCDIS